jgi:hypothetical protein
VTDLFRNADPKPPYARGSQTSADAARRIVPKVVRDRERILSRIVRAGHGDMYKGGGMTDIETEAELDHPLDRLKGSSIRPRRGELVAMGLVEMTLARREGASVWESTALGDAVHGCPELKWLALNRAFDAARRDGLTNEQLADIVKKEWSR